MDCSSCGKELRPGGNFCQACGAPVKEAAADETEETREQAPPVHTTPPWGTTPPHMAPIPGKTPPPPVTPRPGRTPPPPVRTAPVTAPLSKTPPPPASPPAQTGATPPGAKPPPQPGPVTYGQRPVGRKSSGWAVASLIFGILGFTCCPLLGSILAIIFGAVAKSDIKRSQGTRTGSGMATAGIVMGAVVLGVIIIVAAVFIPLTLVQLGPTHTITRHVDANGATKAQVNVKMNTGTLRMSGGSSRLMDARFEYNVNKWKPVVDYNVSNGTGNLDVSQSSSGWWFGWASRNEWTISLSDRIPVDLTANLSAGESFLDLGGTNLTSLDMRSSAGSTDVELPGEMKLLNRVNVSETAGSMNLVMNGTYSAPMNLNVRNTSGGTTVDLTGTWKADMTGDLQSTAGGVTVRLPRDVGVRITASTTVGDVETRGLTASSPNTYVNDAYATASVRIELNVDSTAGSIELQQF